MSNIIGILGKKNSGKTTVYEMLHGILSENETIVKLSFAGKLKEMFSVLAGIKKEHLNKTDTKNMLFKNKLIRVWLQSLGEWGRNMIPDLWIDTTLTNLNPNNVYIIDDVRFKNEVEKIKQLGGMIIKINRPSLKSNDTHISETEMDSILNYDEFIVNDGGLQDLYKKVKSIAKKYYNLEKTF